MSVSLLCQSECGLCPNQPSTLPIHYSCTVDMNYTVELEAELAAMGLPRRSFFQNSTTDTTHILEQSVTVPNNNSALCQTHTVLIRKAVIDRESAFNVSLKAQGMTPLVPRTDGNQSISDLLARPVIIYSPDAELRSVSAFNCDYHMQLLPISTTWCQPARYCSSKCPKCSRLMRDIHTVCASSHTDN